MRPLATMHIDLNAKNPNTQPLHTCTTTYMAGSVAMSGNGMVLMGLRVVSPMYWTSCFIVYSVGLEYSEMQRQTSKHIKTAEDPVLLTCQLWCWQKHSPDKLIGVASSFRGVQRGYNSLCHIGDLYAWVPITATECGQCSTHAPSVSCRAREMSDTAASVKQ